MLLPGLMTGSGDLLSQIYQVMMILSFLIWPVLIVFGPRLYIWYADKRMVKVLEQLEIYRDDVEQLFLGKLTSSKNKELEAKFNTIKDFKFSAPTGIDPAGMVKKLEHVLDTSEHKFDRFIERYADSEDEEDLADLNMAFKGVMGVNQIYKVMEHFRILIKKTGMFQLVSMTQLMMPIYQELAEAQKEATRAFVDRAPIGDTIGPLVAAKLIESEEEVEEMAKNIIVSEEEIEGNKAFVVKSKGPGARLGKYGDALEELAEENELEAIVTVDAGAKFEGEDTGSITEGVGVMMGGPGVEKSKIEEVATEHDVPLEGIIIKQSPAEASKPMKNPIYEAYRPAVEKVEEIVSEFDGEVAVVGVGNTCGVGNDKASTRGIHNKLRKYWEEYEAEEDDVSYIGLLGALPMGGGEQSERLREAKSHFLWRIPR